MKTKTITLWLAGALIVPALVSAQVREKSDTGSTSTSLPDVRPAPDPVPVPPIPPERNVREFIVASPRVSLQEHPPLLQADVASTLNDCRTIGAAHNFHRRSSRFIMLRNENLLVGLDDDTEGVWHPKSCGFLGAGLFLYVYDYRQRGWRKIGNDMRFAHGCGPNKGNGVDIEVLFEPERSGIFALSACAISFALPTDDGTDPANLRKWLRCGDVDVSESYIYVWVVDQIHPYHRRWLQYGETPEVDRKEELARDEISIEVQPGVRAVDAESILGIEAVEEPAPAE